MVVVVVVVVVVIVVVVVGVVVVVVVVVVFVVVVVLLLLRLLRLLLLLLLLDVVDVVIVAVVDVVDCCPNIDDVVACCVLWSHVLFRCRAADARDLDLLKTLGGSTNFGGDGGVRLRRFRTVKGSFRLFFRIKSWGATQGFLISKSNEDGTVR